MNDKENEQIRLLNEILKWIRFSGLKEVKGVLASALDTDQKKIVYQLSDGSKGIVEIGKAAGISSTATISRYWKSWARLGLGDYLAVKGGDRFKRAFDLEDLGIEVPLQKPSGQTGEVTKETTKNEPIEGKSEVEA
jgi:hypothetical protein